MSLSISHIHFTASILVFPKVLSNGPSGANKAQNDPEGATKWTFRNTSHLLHMTEIV